MILKTLIQFEIPDKDKFQQALKEVPEQLGCANERTRLGLYLLNGGTDFPALDADLDEVDDEEESLSAYDRRDIDLLRELKNAGESPWDESPKRVINNNPTRYILFDFFLSHAIKVMPRRSIDESIMTLMPFLDELEADLSTQWNPIHKNFFRFDANDDKQHRLGLLRGVDNIRSKLDARDDSVYLDLWLEAFGWNEWKLLRHREDSIAKVHQIGDLLFRPIHVRKICKRGNPYVKEVVQEQVRLYCDTLWMHHRPLTAFLLEHLLDAAIAEPSYPKALPKDQSVAPPYGAGGVLVYAAVFIAVLYGLLRLMDSAVLPWLGSLADLSVVKTTAGMLVFVLTSVISLILSILSYKGMQFFHAVTYQTRFSKQHIRGQYILYQIRDEVASLSYDGAGVSQWLREQETDSLRFPSMLYALLRLHS
jgi:hypothetical protein